MLLLLMIIMIILGIFKPKSTFITIMASLSMIVIQGFMTDGADYFIYHEEYRMSLLLLITQSDYIGWYILMNACHMLGMEYADFVLFITLVGTGLFLLGIIKLNRHSACVCSLYLIYPFAHQATQLRTFLATSIVIASLHLLINADDKLKKRKIMAYVLICIIAGTIHSLAYFFAVIGIIFMITGEKIDIYKICIIILVMLVFIKSGMMDRAMIMGSNTSKIEGWLGSKQNFGFIIPIIFTILIWWLSKWSLKNVIIEISSHSMENYYYRMMKYIDLVLLIIPLFAYDITFNRLWRVFLIIFYISIAEFLYNVQLRHNNGVQKMIFSILVTVVIMGVFFYEDEWNILIPIVESNAYL